jgi:hypothetical protein
MRRATGALAVAAILAAAAPARADDMTTKEAQARFEEGLGRVKDGDFDGARISFAQAYAVLKKPDILWNLALAEQKSGHPVEAIGHFRQLQRDARTDADRTNASKHVTELLGQTGHIEVAAVSGAQVSVDGSVVGMAPLADQVDVPAGKHHVEAATAQGKKATDIDATLGQVVRVSFLEAAPTVEGKPQPQQPAATDAQPSSPAAPETTPATQRGWWTTPRYIGVGAGALAVVGLGMGIGFRVASSNDASDVSSIRSTITPGACSGAATSATCTDLQDKINAANTNATLSNVSFVVAGVAAAASVALIFFVAPQAQTSAVTWAPVVGVGSIGAIGRF